MPGEFCYVDVLEKVLGSRWLEMLGAGSAANSSFWINQLVKTPACVKVKKSVFGLKCCIIVFQKILRITF